MAKKLQGKSQGNKGGANKPREFVERKAVTQDPRFTGVHSDPRFYIPKTKSLKGSVDDRFKNAIETDERFQDEVTTDKYGRKVKKSQTRKELEKYLDLEDEKEDENSDSSDEGDLQEDEDSESESENEGVKIQVEKKSDRKLSAMDRARGERGSESESSDDSSDEEEESEAEELELEDRSQIPTGDETSRIAVVNMDWDNVRAEDLFVSFNGFVPRGGRLTSVTIYPSEYGKEQMAKELTQGPSSEFFVSTKKAKSTEESDDEEEEDDTSDSEDDEAIRKSLLKEDKGEDVDNDKLRKYQLQRLRYYYCVVETDSVVTAKNIYDNVDGTEFETTSNVFDLRYIPDDTTFDDSEIHDRCVSMPKGYRPHRFTTDVLQNSKVKLTWDETPAERARITSKAFTNKEIEEMDFQAYLASDSDEEEREDLRKKYRALLSGKKDDKESSGIQMDSDYDSDGKDDIDMEFTFGGEDSKAENETSDREENTLEKYKRKQKERKQRRLEELKKKQQGESDDEVTGDSVGSSDVKNNRKQAELELLMMDDNLAVGNNEEKEDGNKKGKKKSKRGKRLEQAEEMEAGFNIQDPRFGDLLSNPEFAIDPTAPQYKKTAAMDQVMKERQKRSREMESSGVRSLKKHKAESSSSTSTQSLVDKIKRRYQSNK